MFHQNANFHISTKFAYILINSIFFFNINFLEQNYNIYTNDRFFSSLQNEFPKGVIRLHYLIGKNKTIIELIYFSH